MKLETVIKKIQTTKKGAYTPVVYQTTIPSNKEYKDVLVTKITRAIVRLGCKYDNLAAVKLARAATLSLGETKKVSARSYNWILDSKGNSLFPYLYQGSKGGVNIRFTVAHNVHYTASKVVGYYANGIEITKEQAMLYTRPSAWEVRKGAFDVFDKHIEDIISIGDK